MAVPDGRCRPTVGGSRGQERRGQLEKWARSSAPPSWRLFSLAASIFVRTPLTEQHSENEVHSLGAALRLALPLLVEAGTYVASTESPLPARTSRRRHTDTPESVTPSRPCRRGSRRKTIRPKLDISHRSSIGPYGFSILERRLAATPVIHVSFLKVARRCHRLLQKRRLPFGSPREASSADVGAQAWTHRRSACRYCFVDKRQSLVFLLRILALAAPLVCESTRGS